MDHYASESMSVIPLQHRTILFGCLLSGWVEKFRGVILIIRKLLIKNNNFLKYN